MIIATAIAINNNVSTTQRMLRRGLASGLTGQSQMTDLGKQCMALVKKDRAALKREKVLARIEELKATGMLHRDILKTVIDW